MFEKLKNLIQEIPLQPIDKTFDIIVKYLDKYYGDKFEERHRALACITEILRDLNIKL